MVRRVGLCNILRSIELLCFYQTDYYHYYYLLREGSKDHSCRNAYFWAYI